MHLVKYLYDMHRASADSMSYLPSEKKLLIGAKWHTIKDQTGRQHSRTRSMKQWKQKTETEESAKHLNGFLISHIR